MFLWPGSIIQAPLDVLKTRSENRPLLRGGGPTRHEDEGSGCVERGGE